MTVKHVMANMFLEELFEEVMIDTLPGVLLYKIGDELNNIKLQQYGKLAGDMSLSLILGFDLKMAQLDAFGVKVGDVGLGKARFQFGISRVLDLRKGFVRGQSLDISKMDQLDVELTKAVYISEGRRVSVDWSNGKMNLGMTRAEFGLALNQVVMEVMQWNCYSMPAIVG